ncbi:MAG: hypothetical protein IPJ19_07680 [Planctomycetes bacterium]|nr:hypothetical protein [Planctomycetota bacterium]
MGLPFPWLLALFVLGFAGEGKRRPDSVVLVNGTKLAGVVVYQDAAELVLRVGTRDTSYPMKEVSKVDALAANLAEFIDTWLSSKPDDEEALRDLANRCERCELAFEELLLRWKLVLAHPSSEEYHKALGHELRDGVWGLRDGERWVPLSTWLEPREMKNAWRLESTHFVLATDGDFALGIDVLLDLECLYRAFFQKFGRELHSYEVVERIGVELQSRKRNFSAPTKNAVSWFDPRGNVIYIDGEKGVDRARMLMDGTRALLCNSGSRQRVIDGVIPPWIEAGLSTWVGWNLHGELGRARWEPAPFTAMYRRVLEHDMREPVKVTRLLNTAPLDYDESELGQEHYAEAFTLVDFMLGAAGEKYRLRFLDFLRETYRGKGAPPQLYEALDRKGAEIEAEWLAWIRSGGYARRR